MHMSDNIPKIKKTESEYREIFEEYVLWFAMPDKQKEIMGIESDTAFADEWEINRRTLLTWRDRPEFETKVRHLLKKWAFGKTGNVIMGMYKAAVRGNDRSQKLWMQVFEGFTEKTETTQTIKVELNPGDIRFIVDGFPEHLKEKYYGYLREILDTAIALRNAGQLSDGTPTGSYIEADVRESSDNDAQHLSGKRADALATRHKASVCEDVGNSADRTAYLSPHNY